ncbi:MAG TPA: thioredoxin domain-containing protein [Gemmatimonadaceae bacterium]|nr:thioredoxin domain-containing protein [Gemmatimonadaceae bacterium]
MGLVRVTALATLIAACAVAGCGSSAGNRASSTSASAAVAAQPPASETATKTDTALNRAADHARVQGNANAPLWVVEISDFQCPFCREWHEESYAAIKSQYVDTGKIRFAYINYPLSIHKNAWPAAESAMCAAAQGKFWPMHDALFASQSRWENAANPQPALDSIAASVGVSHDAYTTCVTQHSMRALIQADVDRANESGVTATPTFIIGTAKITGAQPLDQFRSVVDAQLAKVKAQ